MTKLERQLWGRLGPAAAPAVVEHIVTAMVARNRRRRYAMACFAELRRADMR